MGCVEGSAAYARHFQDRSLPRAEGSGSALVPKRRISLNSPPRALADFQPRAGFRAHPAKLARSQFSEWSSIEIENQNLTFIHEHFRTRLGL